MPESDPNAISAENTHKILTALREELSEIKEHQQQSKKDQEDQDDHSKDFFWDQAVKLLASGMLALTVLEVLSSISGEAVQCLTPENYTRDQGAFINSFCTQFTQRTNYFLFLLVAQSVLVYGPHFIWSSIFHGKLRYFIALALSLGRHRNSKTGEFDLKNFVTVRALKETFGSTHRIYISYIGKLFLQLVIAGVFIGVCASLFNEYDPSFDCPANDSLHLINITWPLDEQIMCVLSSLNLLFGVWWTNFVLLAGTVVVSVYGLVWSGLNHQTKLNWNQVARFTLQSGIQPSYYHPKSWKDRWFSRYALRYRIRSNLDFLVLRLYQDDAGRAKVLREVLIALFIKEHEQTLQERLSFLRARKADADTCRSLLNKVEKEWSRRKEKGRCYCMKKKAKEIQPKRCNCLQRAKKGHDLGNTLEQVLCNFLTNTIMELDWVNAIDISFGSSGFKMLIATLAGCDKVLSVNFDPRYLNEDNSFEKRSFLSEVISFRTWSTIFSKKEKDINTFRDRIAEHFFDRQQWKQGVGPLLEKGEGPKYPHQSANVILVGPIPEKDAQYVTTVHLLLMMLIKHKLLNMRCYLVTVRPRRVEGKEVKFKEFEPESWVVDKGEGSGSTGEIAYLRNRQRADGGIDNYYSSCYQTTEEDETPGLNCCSTLLKSASPMQLKTVYVKCGSSLCEFEIKVYKVKVVAPQGHQASPQLPPRS